MSNIAEERGNITNGRAVIRKRKYEEPNEEGGLGETTSWLPPTVLRSKTRSKRGKYVGAKGFGGRFDSLRLSAAVYRAKC